MWIMRLALAGKSQRTLCGWRMVQNVAPSLAGSRLKGREGRRHQLPRSKGLPLRSRARASGDRPTGASRRCCTSPCSRCTCRAGIKYEANACSSTDETVSDVVIDDPSISRAQAAIINSSSATFLQDMDSAHGTWLDLEGRLMAVPQLGDRLDPESEPTKLVEGATFRLGSSNTVFRVVGVEPEVVDKWKPPPWTEPPSRPCALDVRSNTYSNPYLAHRLDEDGGDVDETIRLSGRCTVIGRSSQLADLLVRHESLSRQHAALMYAEKDTFLQDLGSASGTFIDGKRLPANEPTKLAEGAQITFGDSKATYTYRANIGSSGSSGGKRKR